MLRSQGYSSADLGHFDLIGPVIQTKLQDFRQIWTMSHNIATKLVISITFPIAKGVILTHFPLARVWFLLWISIAKGMVAKTRAAHPMTDLIRFGTASGPIYGLLKRRNSWQTKILTSTIFALNPKW